MKVVIAAGASGGHIFPGIAVAEEFRSRSSSYEVIFVGTGKELERSILSGTDFCLASVPERAVKGRGLKGLFKLAFSLPKAIKATKKLYKNFQPDVVIGFGGYPSFVPVFTAWLMGIPRVLHEQNLKVGLANKFLSLISSKTFSVPGAKGFLKGKPVEIYNPVRKSFYDASNFVEPQKESFVLTVCGGSQGAKEVNSAIIELVPLFKKYGISLIHQTGKLDFERVSQAYKDADFEALKVCSFIDNMVDVYSGSHLVVSRAGAMSVAEITASQRPAIYIPLELAGGHQRDNVCAVVDAGGAEVIYSGPELARRLSDALERIFKEPSRLSTMVQSLQSLRSDSRPCEVIVNEVVKLAA